MKCGIKARFRCCWCARGTLNSRENKFHFWINRSAKCKIAAWKLIPALDLLRRVRNNSCRRMPEKNTAKNRKLSRQELRDLEIKISFMEGIVRRDPRYVEALQILGDHYTQRGRYDHSLKVDKRLSRLEPQNPLVFYNLACSYSLNSEF